MCEVHVYIIYIYTVQCAICLQYNEISHPVCTADLHNLATASELCTSLPRIQIVFYLACCAGRWLKIVLQTVLPLWHYAAAIHSRKIPPMRSPTIVSTVQQYDKCAAIFSYPLHQGARVSRLYPRRRDPTFSEPSQDCINPLFTCSITQGVK